MTFCSRCVKASTSRSGMTDRRPWSTMKLSPISHNLEELAKAAGGKAAITVFRRQWTADAHAAIDRADRPERHKDAMVAVSTHALRLTKDEAKTLAAEINDLVDGWREKGQKSKSGRTYEVLWVLQPAPEVSQ